jgi:hypothetical protein
VEELSGVLGAQQGKAPTSGTPAALYAQQQLQASMTTLVFFDTFFNGLYELDRKLLQVILQFYNEKRAIATDPRAPLVQFDPERVRNISWDVAIADAADTASFRMQFEESLMQFLQGQHITFDQFLEVSSHPKAQELQKLIERTNPLIQQPSALDTAPPELAGALMQAAQAGDTDAATMLMQANNYPAQAQQIAGTQQGAPIQAPAAGGPAAGGAQAPTPPME